MDKYISTVKAIYTKYLGISPARINPKDILSDKKLAIEGTIIAIQIVLDSMMHEDNKMYYEILFWKSCLEVAVGMRRNKEGPNE